MFEPPFRIRYHLIIVFVDLGEKIVQLGLRDRDPGSGKRAPELVFVDFTVIVAIDRLEHLPEARLGMVDKRSEL